MPPPSGPLLPVGAGLSLALMHAASAWPECDELDLRPHGMDLPSPLGTCVGGGALATYWVREVLACAG